MEHGLTSTLDQPNTACLILGVFNDVPLPKLPLSEATLTLIQTLLGKLQEPQDTVYQADHNGQALALIHCGSLNDYTIASLSKSIQQIAKLVIQQRLTSVTLALPPLAGNTANSQIEHMVLQLEAQCYQFLEFKTQKKQPYAIESATWYLPEASEAALKTARTIANSIKFTRDLANLPANICTPTYLAKQAHIIDTNWDNITSKAIDKHAMESMGMGALLAVSQGSDEPPQLIVIKYNGKPTDAPIVLVGKGITFDSGGISLKPPEGMEEMKYDMSGAASVLAVIEACARLKLPIQVIGLLACAENLPSGTAVKPGDVVTSMSGQTIEITNTDAEGRLVLADTLTYAKQFNPKFVIDIATLTGAVIVALGAVNSGLMSNDDELANLLLTASAQSQDKLWRLPLEPAYQEMINSPVADIMNSTPGRAAGSITAACFLSRFTETFRWAHIDIAGTAWVSGKDRTATGRPVALLMQFLRNLSNHAH
jgi:leucyl aminopeptidase